jgi:hypothetical protein
MCELHVRLEVNEAASERWEVEHVDAVFELHDETMNERYNTQMWVFYKVIDLYQDVV